MKKGYGGRDSRSPSPKHGRFQSYQQKTSHRSRSRSPIAGTSASNSLFKNHSAIKTKPDTTTGHYRDGNFSGYYTGIQSQNPHNETVQVGITAANVAAGNNNSTSAIVTNYNKHSVAKFGNLNAIAADTSIASDIPKNPSERQQYGSDDKQDNSSITFPMKTNNMPMITPTSSTSMPYHTSYNMPPSNASATLPNAYNYGAIPPDQLSLFMAPPPPPPPVTLQSAVNQYPPHTMAAYNNTGGPTSGGQQQQHYAYPPGMFPCHQMMYQFPSSTTDPMYIPLYNSK